MALIHVEGYEDPIEGSPAVSLLNNLLRAGVRISHLCGGKAGCGTCRVRFISGEALASPMGERERARLAGGDGTLPEHVRLACQTHVRGEVSIRVLAPGKQTGR